MSTYKQETLTMVWDNPNKDNASEVTPLGGKDSAIQDHLRIETSHHPAAYAPPGAPNTGGSG